MFCIACANLLSQFAHMKYTASPIISMIEFIIGCIVNVTKANGHSSILTLIITEIVYVNVNWQGTWSNE